MKIWLWANVKRILGYDFGPAVWISVKIKKCGFIFHIFRTTSSIFDWTLSLDDGGLIFKFF